MSMPKMTFTVYLNPQGDGEPREVTVENRHVDRLQAELAMKQLMLPDDAAMHITTAWAWAGLKRTGEYDGPLGRFMSVDCLHLDIDEDEAGVPPTQSAAPDDSASPSA